ncbi:MAG TPA: glycosyltransferase [Bacteroidia bacterium]|nr:glycosyltransferase [Bacteroidia bacterium]
MNKLLVSISCLTYNHAPYIKQTIDGFLMQKTNFDFEILIHDDASNDGTAKIIQEYESKYPNLIKPIYQKENQWSKGVRSISAKYNFPRAKGKYIAMCEGDDYWTDPLKLQKQVDLLEDNNKVGIVFHPCYTEIKGITNKNIYFKNDNYKINTIDILTSEGQFAPTSSYVFRKSILDTFPDWIKYAPVGDFFIEIYATKIYYGIYMKEPMSVYRIDTPSSWTVNTLKKNRLNFNLQMAKFIKLAMNDFSKNNKPVFSNLISYKYLNSAIIFYNNNNFKKFKYYINLYSKYSMNYSFYKLKIQFTALNISLFSIIKMLRPKL